MRKIVFLDIDGVLNHQNFLIDAQKLRKELREAGRHDEVEGFHSIHQINPDAVALLNEIYRATQCEFVLSSSWRILHKPGEVGDILRFHGFEGTIVDQTPGRFQLEPGSWSRRGHEIAKWLRENTEGQVRFVILDDDSDMDTVEDALVQTSWQLGLLDEHVSEVIERLNR